jgi:TATA-box binding protein (TBP) (component of TFIID and TFIIIB)
MTDNAVADSLAVQNVVAAAAIDTELDLHPVADDLDGADYTPDPSPTCTYTPAETATTVRLFRSGELIALGAPSRTAARDSLTPAIDDLERLGLPVPAAPEITIEPTKAAARKQMQEWLTDHPVLITD